MTATIEQHKGELIMKITAQDTLESIALDAFLKQKGKLTIYNEESDAYLSPRAFTLGINNTTI